MSGKYVLLQVILCLFSLGAWAQVQPVPDAPAQQRDTLALPKSDTLRVALPEQKQVQGDITTTINYNAKDSILFDAANKIVYLYGDATIDYGDIKLQAAQITIDWTTSTLTAVGVKDSLNKEVGKPVFTQGQETFVTDNIRYNFKSRKAVIQGVVTQQEEAFIHGNVVKKDAQNQLYIRGARYTTCNLPDPHFHIHASKLKVMPNDKIVSGPFHLKIANISTPLGFLFGMFPAPRKRVSGVIIPTYGEEARRGFFLREGGYYFAISDYMDLAVTGEIYTKGSRGFQIASNYRKRYQYGGNYSLRFNRQNVGQEGEDNVSRDFWLNWSHNPESKGSSRFSASVNFGTSSFTNNNPSINNFERNLNQQFSSSINYSNSFPGTPFNLSARASMVQDIVKETADIILPDIGLNMQRQYPFRPKGSSGKAWWQQINFSYTGSATNRISTRRPASSISGLRVLNAVANDQPTPLNLDNIPQLFRQANNGIKHNIPISTSFNLLKHFTVSPSFNYQEVWYFRRLGYEFDQERNGVVVDTTSGFSRAGSYSLSAGLSTKVYGFFYFNKKNPTPKVQAIRHMIIPTLSFGYAPDRSGRGVERVIVGTDENLDPIFRDLSIYNGFAYGFPQSGQQGSIGFSITNNFEMKVREKGDTATTYKKVPLLERLSFNGSYNMLAPTHRLSNISISGNTSLFNNLIMLTFGGTVDPYLYRRDSVAFGSGGSERIFQTRTNDLAIMKGAGLGRLQNVNVGFSTQLSSTGLKGKPNKAGPPTGGNVSPEGEQVLDEGSPIGNELGKEGLAYRYTDPTEYVDFTLPWSLRFNYTLSYQKTGFQESTITQATNFSGDLKVTDKWKIGYSSGFDLKNKEFTATRLSIYRDLHCWQMNVNWVPFGRFQSFSVDIRVKAAILQDLKLSRRRSFFDY